MKWLILGFLSIFLTSIGLTLIPVNSYLYPAYLTVFLITIIISTSLNQKTYLLLFCYFLIYDLLFSSIFGVTILANIIITLVAIIYKNKVTINFFSYIFIIFITFILYNSTIFIFLNIIDYLNLPINYLYNQLLKSTFSILIFFPICYFSCIYRRKLPLRKKLKFK